MVCCSEETCLLLCKLTSISTIRELSLLKAQLEINPSLAEFIEEIEKVDILNDSISLEPGESFDCLFKLKIKKIDAEAIKKINYMFADSDDPL
jgi:hypothetical protein